MNEEEQVAQIEDDKTEPEIENPMVSEKPTVSPAKIKEQIKNLPEKIATDIEDGKGNKIIESLQKSITAGIQAIFSSCRILILQQYLLSEKTRDAITMNCYVVAFIIFVIEGLSLFFELSVGAILLALEAVLAAFIADKLIHNTQSKEPSQKKKQQKKKESFSDDYL